MQNFTISEQIEYFLVIWNLHLIQKKNFAAVYGTIFTINPLKRNSCHYLDILNNVRRILHKYEEGK
jgi:hypothetical protein